MLNLTSAHAKTSTADALYQTTMRKSAGSRKGWRFLIAKPRSLTFDFDRNKELLKRISPAIRSLVDRVILLFSFLFFFPSKPTYIILRALIRRLKIWNLSSLDHVSRILVVASRLHLPFLRGKVNILRSARPKAR